MRKIGAIVAVALATLVGLYAVPSADQPPQRPSGRLVLGLLSPEERVAVVDVRSGRTVSKRLPGGTLCHGPLVVVGGRLVFAGSSQGRPAAMSLDLGLNRPAQAVGEADQFFPSATPGRLWLARLADRRRADTYSSLREVTVAGRTTFASRHRMPARYVTGATTEGILFERLRSLELWDPRRGEVARRLRGYFLVATQGRRLAWCPPGCKKLRVAEAGGDRAIRPNRGLPFAEGARGAFSPDGSLLALPVGRDHNRLALVNLEKGSVEQVPGARLGTYDGALAWSRSGKWLFYATRRSRLMAYRPGSQRALALPVRLRGTVMSIAVG